MSMHIEGPWLSTTGKKKGKKKFSSAEAKRRSEELDASWNDLKSRWGETGSDKLNHRSSKKEYKPREFKYRGQELLELPSKKDSGVAAKPEQKQYTGNAVVGIAVMHKSCLQPVFSKEAAEDSAKMRR